MRLATRQIDRARGPRRPGYTILELTIAFAVLILILVGVLALFDLNSKLARAQTHVADMQQSLRIGQYDMMRMVRMAGRGPLPRGVLPQGVAVAVRNDVPDAGDQHHIAVGDTDSPEVLVGTDVLTIRGIFTTPIYQINPAASDFVLNSPVAPTAGSITIRNPSPDTGITQDTQPLIDAVTDGLPDALLLVSPVDDDIFAVVELNPTGPNTDTSDPSAVTLDFTITGGTYTDDYLAINPSGAYPATLNTVAFVGLLEEYRYYIREEYQIPGDKSSDLTPRLSLARLYPGTEVAYGGDATNLQSDIADNILDLQVALAVDTDGDETTALVEDGTAGDDWLFNSPDDDPTDNDKWNNATLDQPIYYVRLTSLARTDRRDRGYLAPAIQVLEDHDYSESDPPGSQDELESRMFRRRLLQTVVDLRNLS